jgi:hypothetical protein
MKAFSLLLIFILVGGCARKIDYTGEDKAFLADFTNTDTGVAASELLPLKTGSVWEMSASSPVGNSRDRLVVGATQTIGGVTGTEVVIYRNGAVWRRDVYANDANGLRLLAFGEDKQGLLVLDPPMPLSKPLVRTSESLLWRGTLMLNKMKLPATGFSRVSGKPNIRTRLGTYQSYRIDTVITIVTPAPEGKTHHFPTMRWLSRGIGIVQRGYADDSRPGIAILDRYITAGSDVKSATPASLGATLTGNPSR